VSLPPNVASGQVWYEIIATRNLHLAFPAFTLYNVRRTGWVQLSQSCSAPATVAQLVEQTIRNRQVKGSNPFGGSIKQRLQSAVLLFIHQSSFPFAMLPV
jgi:hypothetical protein